MHATSEDPEQKLRGPRVVSSHSSTASTQEPSRTYGIGRGAAMEGCPRQGPWGGGARALLMRWQERRRHHGNLNRIAEARPVGFLLMPLWPFSRWRMPCSSGCGACYGM